MVAAALMSQAGSQELCNGLLMPYVSVPACLLSGQTYVMPNYCLGIAQEVSPFGASLVLHSEIACCTSAFADLYPGWMRLCEGAAQHWREEGACPHATPAQLRQGGAAVLAQHLRQTESTMYMQRNAMWSIS